jgi:tetratricopeptide (TPR) repeat protein
MINLLRAGAQATTSLRPVASPVQASASDRGATQSAEESISLEPGKPVERELSGGQSHSYKITTISGQYLQVVVAQRGIDMVVVLFAPDGRKISEADNDHLIEGKETVSAITEAPGAYLIEARSPEKTAKAGRYEIKVEELRAATAEDKYRVAGETIFREAERLSYGTLEAKRESVQKYHEALDLYRRAGARSEEAVTLNDIGVLYWGLGEMQKALEKLNEALAIWRTVGDRNRVTETLNNIGVVYQSMGDMQKALEMHNEALPLRRAVGDRRGESAALNNIGRVYDEMEERQKALEKYNEALQINRAAGDRAGEAITLHSIGAALDALGEAQKALEKYNEALPLRREVSDRNGEATTLLRIAQAEQKRGNLTQARQTIEQALGIIESLRTNIVGQELRASYFASRQAFFETYIDVLMQMCKQNPAAGFDALALAVSERARARSLLELLKEARADIRQGVDGSLLERERSLQQRLNARAAAQARLLNGKHTPEQAAAAAKEIDAITSEYDEIQAQIRARSPRYAALTQPQPLGLTEIQQQVLDPDTLLLEYSLGENASYLFVVSQTSITSHRLPKRAEIEAATRRVRELLTAPQPHLGDTDAKYQARVKEAEESYWPKAAELSRMLVGPAASQLGKKRLAIVADGALQYIPFAALPEPSPENDKGENSGGVLKPLFVEHEIVSLPSASTLATLRRETAGRKPAEKSLAVLADPVFTDDDTRVRRDASKAIAQRKTRSVDPDEVGIGFLQMTRSGRETGVVGSESGFGRLLSTRREATAISALVPERERMQALDFEASRATARRPELGEYRIVHFATHGLLNNIHPKLSGKECSGRRD